MVESTEEHVVVHIGLDDIDSPFNGCTTHFTYMFIKKYLLMNENIEFIDYPNLVRLNPSIPFKTRGNGAVALRIKVRKPYKDVLIKALTNSLTDYINAYDVKSKYSPGVAIVEGNIPVELSRIYMKALTDYVHIDYLRNLLNKVNNIELPLGISRGVIGALAAIGWPQDTDCTYELLAYRLIGNIGRERCIDWNSLREVDVKYKDYVFNNYDHVEDVPLVAPHGSDPVLLGIRGNDPEILVKYFNELNLCEAVDGWMIYRTNQGTDAHLVLRSIDDVRPYRTLCVETSVKSRPKVLRGAHVVIEIHSSPKTYAAFYADTSLTNVARDLNVDDEVIICGSVKQWSNNTNVLNVEKLYIKRKIIKEIHNPKCPKCGKRMKSLGRDKGFKCVRCGFKSKEITKDINISIISLNSLHVVKTSKMKHLSKPLSRHGRERKCSYLIPTSKWIEVYV